MNNKCTIYRTADFIGKRWTLLILLELHKGQGGFRRFNQLKNSLPGITSKMLSERLKELEEVRMIIKKVDSSSVPIRCEYSLSGSGKDFIRIIKGMKRWALRWKIKNKACDLTDCKHCTF